MRRYWLIGLMVGSGCSRPNPYAAEESSGSTTGSVGTTAALMTGGTSGAATTDVEPMLTAGPSAVATEVSSTADHETGDPGSTTIAASGEPQTSAEASEGTASTTGGSTESGVETDTDTGPAELCPSETHRCIAAPKYPFRFVDNPDNPSVVYGYMGDPAEAPDCVGSAPRLEMDGNYTTPRAECSCTCEATGSTCPSYPTLRVGPTLNPGNPCVITSPRAFIAPAIGTSCTMVPPNQGTTDPIDLAAGTLLWFVAEGFAPLVGGRCRMASGADFPPSVVDRGFRGCPVEERRCENEEEICVEDNASTFNLGVCVFRDFDPYFDEGRPLETLCPDEFPVFHPTFDGFEDSRDCTTCSCPSTPSGGCDGHIELFSGGCSGPNGVDTVTIAYADSISGNMCSTTNTSATVNAARWVPAPTIEQSCPPSGGRPTGSITPHQTDLILCCQL